MGCPAGRAPSRGVALAPLPLLALLLAAGMAAAAPIASESEQRSGCGVTLDVAKTIQWWSTVMSCANATISNCPGNSPCTDAEYLARSLAFGGAIALKADAPAGCPGFGCYEMPTQPGKFFNLALTDGLVDWLEAAGFTKSAASAEAAPQGAVLLVQGYKAPALALGGGRCSAHTPLVHGGPHCGVACSYLAPTPNLLHGVYVC